MAREVATRSSKVIVVGGGLAGLMAAHSLSGRFSVTLYEARDRVGGRVCTLVDTDTQRITEAGAELIGYARATWLTLAKHFGLGLSVWTSESDFDRLRLEMPLHLDGRLLDAKEAEQVYEEMGSALRHMTADAHIIEDPWRPWKAAKARHWDNEPLSDWIKKHSPNDLVQAALESQFANTNGAPTNRQSYLANLAVIAGADFDGHPGDFFTLSENVRCAEGNQTLAHKLAQAVESLGGKVCLHRPVSRIVIQSDKVSVALTDGTADDADFVILAVPPSLWSDDPSCVQVDPPIPDDYRMSMGIAIKYLTRSATRFWIQESKAPSGVSEACGMIWEGTDNQMQTPGQDVELTLFAGGDSAEAALQELQARGMEAVERFYDERIGSLYSTFARARRPGPRFVAWPLEEWTGTGYSCPGVGDVLRVGPNLLEPWKQRLYIAGEHACLPFFGYMEGALQSGRRVAEEILKL